MEHFARGTLALYALTFGWLPLVAGLTPSALVVAGVVLEQKGYSAHQIDPTVQIEIFSAAIVIALVFLFLLHGSSTGVPNPYYAPGDVPPLSWRPCISAGYICLAYISRRKLVQRDHMLYCDCTSFYSSRAPLYLMNGIGLLEKYLNWSLETIGDWATQLTNPPNALNRYVIESSRYGFRGVVRRFWLFPIIFSIFLDTVLVFSAFGSDLQSKGPAFALYLVYTFLKWFIGAGLIHLLLNCFRQTSNFNIVVACYTIFVIWAPIFSLLESPGLYNQMWLVSQLRSRQLDLVGTIKYLMDHANELKQPEFWSFATTLLWQVESAIFLIVGVFVAESLTTRLLNDRVKTYLVEWLSSVISLLPLAILNMLWVAVEWRHAINELNIPN
jgi:hypothetical protein